MYILEDDFNKVLLTEEEKDLVIQMDCENLHLYKSYNDFFSEKLKEIKEGLKIFFCKYDEYPVEVSLRETHPFHIDILSYDENYDFYSFIIAKNEIEANKKFIGIIKKLGVLKPEVDMDEAIIEDESKKIRTIEVKIEDKFPERTKMKSKRSEELLKSMFGVKQ